MDHKRREQLVPRHSLRRESRRPDRDSNQEKQSKLEDHHHAGPDESDARILERSGGKQSLHDQVVGAMRRRREKRASQQPAHEGVGPAEIDARIDQLQLVRAMRSKERDLWSPAEGQRDKESSDAA